jgi:hypothetical protein
MKSNTMSCSHSGFHADKPRVLDWCAIRKRLAKIHENTPRQCRFALQFFLCVRDVVVEAFDAPDPGSGPLCLGPVVVQNVMKEVMLGAACNRQARLPAIHNTWFQESEGIVSSCTRFLVRKIPRKWTFGQVESIVFPIHKHLDDSVQQAVAIWHVL